jgi:hypothetical protein
MIDITPVFPMPSVTIVMGTGSVKVILSCLAVLHGGMRKPFMKVARLA